MYDTLHGYAQICTWAGMTRVVRPSVASAARNRILSALQPSVRKPLTPSLERLRLHQEDVLYEVHALLKYFYFDGPVRHLPVSVELLNSGRVSTSWLVVSRVTRQR